MIRSLGLVLVIVLVVFFLARPPGRDEQAIRVVDPTGDVKAFSSAVPGGAVPHTLPVGWRATVSDYDPETGLLRIGWVTPSDEYAEYAAHPRPEATFVKDITGEAPKVGTVQIDGATWDHYRREDANSLIRSFGTTLVVLGTKRDSASLEELRVLAGALSG
jgi:hypothetical protein